MKVRDPPLFAFDQALVVQVGIADEGFFLESHKNTQLVREAPLQAD
jgi:hypothetical protein